VKILCIFYLRFMSSFIGAMPTAEFMIVYDEIRGNDKYREIFPVFALKLI